MRVLVRGCEEGVAIKQFAAIILLNNMATCTCTLFICHE